MTAAFGGGAALALTLPFLLHWTAVALAAAAGAAAMGSALGQLARRRRRRTHAVARKRLRHDVEQHYGVAVVDGDLPVHTYASQRLLVRVDGIERSLTAAVAARWEPVRLFERGFDELPPAAARQLAAATPDGYARSAQS